MSFTTVGVKWLAVLMIITLCDGAPIEEEPKHADIAKESFLPQLKANVEGHFAKFMEKTAEDALLNLKLYRFKASESADKSNIMKIFSPRRQQKFSISVKWPPNEQTTPSDSADLVKMDATTPNDDVVADTVQKNDNFQDVSLVHDPMNLNMESTDDMENVDSSTDSPWTDATTENYSQARESEEIATTERVLVEERTTTDARVSVVNQEDLSERVGEPSTSLPTETPVTETATDEMKADEKDESSNQGSKTEKEQNTTEFSRESTELGGTTEASHRETSTHEVSTTSAEPKENSVPEEIPVRTTPNEWFAIETVDGSKEENEEATEEPIQENVSLKITAPIKRSANPKAAVDSPRRGIFQLFPNAVTTTKKEMHGKPLRESTEKHSALNHQQVTTERSLPSEKPTSVTTVPTTIVITDKEQQVGLSVEGSTIDAPKSEVKVEKNDRTTETVNANQNADDRKREMVEGTLNESESQATNQQTNVHQTMFINTLVPESTSSKTVNIVLDLSTTTEDESAKQTESSSPKNSIVGSVQDQVATITEENSSSVTELPLAAQATKSETTTLGTVESKPVPTVDSSPKNEAITTTTQIISTHKNTQTKPDSTTVKTAMKPTAKTSDKKPEAKKSNVELLMSSFPNPNAHSAPHPLFSRIMLTAPLRPMQMPIFMQRNVNRNANKNANPLLGIASPVFRRRKHVKRSAGRIDDEDRVFVSPKPFGKLPGEQQLGSTQRPTLWQRYREMDSVEKAERKKVVVEKMMHGVNIAGHIDGYLTNTFKSGVAALHRALNGSN